MPGELLTDTWLSYDHKVLSNQSFQLFFLTFSSTPGTLLIKDAQTDSLLFVQQGCDRNNCVSFFTSVQIYEFHISKIIIHHLDGLFGPNILTSSQLAC